MEQKIWITVDWPGLLGIFGTMFVVTWLAASQFSRVETLLEGLDSRLSGIETSIQELQNRQLK